MPFKRPSQMRLMEKLEKQDMTFLKTYRSNLENINQMTQRPGFENIHQTPVKKQNGMPMKRKCQYG